MNDSIYSKRQQDLRKVLDKRGLDGILITNLTNVRYISGFTGSAASCLITPEGQYFITDGRYIEQSKAQVKGFERFISMPPQLTFFIPIVSPAWRIIFSTRSILSL